MGPFCYPLKQKGGIGGGLTAPMNGQVGAETQRGQLFGRLRSSRDQLELTLGLGSEVE